MRVKTTHIAANTPPIGNDLRRVSSKEFRCELQKARLLFEGGEKRVVFFQLIHAANAAAVFAAHITGRQLRHDLAHIAGNSGFDVCHLRFGDEVRQKQKAIAMFDDLWVTLVKL
jgi:hypothetical protein